MFTPVAFLNISVCHPQHSILEKSRNVTSKLLVYCKLSLTDTEGMPFHDFSKPSSIEMKAEQSLMVIHITERTINL